MPLMLCDFNLLFHHIMLYVGPSQRDASKLNFSIAVVEDKEMGLRVYFPQVHCTCRWKLTLPIEEATNCMHRTHAPILQLIKLISCMLIFPTQYCAVLDKDLWRGMFRLKPFQFLND